MKHRGPVALFVAWALHDIEEAIAFPKTCERLADRSGIESVRMDARQSWVAVGLMGVLIAAACRRGARRGGDSRLYRFVVAGLEAHVAIHIVASVIQRGYTAGVATAIPVMLPGAGIARRELRRSGRPLQLRDYLGAAAILMPAVLLCHVLARVLPRRGLLNGGTQSGYAVGPSSDAGTRCHAPPIGRMNDRNARC